jgi:hypothetical protein
VERELRALSPSLAREPSITRPDGHEQRFALRARSGPLSRAADRPPDRENHDVPGDRDRAHGGHAAAPYDARHLTRPVRPRQHRAWLPDAPSRWRQFLERMVHLSQDISCNRSAHGLDRPSRRDSAGIDRPACSLAGVDGTSLACCEVPAAVYTVDRLPNVRPRARRCAIRPPARAGGRRRTARTLPRDLNVPSTHGRSRPDAQSLRDDPSGRPPIRQICALDPRVARDVVVHCARHRPFRVTPEWTVRVGRRAAPRGRCR